MPGEHQARRIPCSMAEKDKFIRPSNFNSCKYVLNCTTLKIIDKSMIKAKIRKHEMYLEDGL